MNTRTLAIAATAVGIALTAGITSAWAATDSGDTLRDWMQGQHEEIRTALDSGDYESWSALSLERNQRIKEEADAQITEEHFATMQHVHELHEAGDHEAARELMEESGLDFGMSHGAPGQPGRGMMQHRFGDDAPAASNDN